MEKGNYTISDIYQGGYSSLSPSYEDAFVGYNIPAGDIALTHDPRTANFVQSASNALSTGLKNIEIQGTDKVMLESIPNNQWKELQRLGKLTGVGFTFHGQVVEPSGIGQQGFSEEEREATERQMWQAVERAHEVSPKGNIPVTFHSSAQLPGEIVPKDKEHPAEIITINTESGEFKRIPLTKRTWPGESTIISPENEIYKRNEDFWTKNISHINYYAELGGDAVDRSAVIKSLAEKQKEAGNQLSPEEMQARTVYNRGLSYLEDSYRGIRDLFDIAYRKGSDKDKKILNNYYSEIEEQAKKIKQGKKNFEYLQAIRDVVQKGTDVLNQVQPPLIIESLNSYAKGRTTDTFANLAFKSYKEYKNNAPIISIENPPAGGAFSTGKELKEIVEEARKKFVERAIKSKSEGGLGLSKSIAKDQADKILGVTWDVGHINMLRKHGYEKKDIIKESKEVAPMVKHVHLSDNFGFEHTELPMGMGNVPVKEIMEKLGKEGYEGKKVIEAFQWIQHFKSPPVKETLQAFGSPFYSTGAPGYWNQSSGLQQDYYPGFGMMLPQVNYETFGAGFSQLPMELGGQRQGAQGSRMSGRGME